MTPQLQDPWIELVWERLLEEFDYDFDDIFEAEDHELWQVVFETIIENADPRDLPQIPLDGPVVDNDDASHVRDEHGRFVAN